MKKILLIIIVFSISFSCTEMLEQVDPTGPTGDDFFANETDLNYALNAAYAGLTSDHLFSRYLGGIERLSDNLYDGGTEGAIGQLKSFSFDPSNGIITNIYRDLYITINRANIVISKGPEVPDVSSEDLKNYLGQAYFIRGYSYFLLTLLYRDVPIILEPSEDPAGTYIPKSNASDVYDQVISDLKIAESDCLSSQTEKGRITSWSAKSMLAKVYLFGADELNKSDWYVKAENYAKEVIQSGTYSLYNDPDKTPAENLLEIFDLKNETRTDKEEIFYIQAYNGGANWSDGDVALQIPMVFNARYNRKYNLWGFGFGYVFEANKFIWEEGDARRDYNLWFQDEPIIINGKTVGKYDQTKQARPNAKPNGSCIQKFWYAENFKRVNGRSNQNWPVLRYADLLLIHTEADLMEDNNLSADGLNSINLVRNRAGLPDLSIAEVTREKILHERRVELFGELQRWFDLVRTRTAEQAFALISAGDTDGDDTEKMGFNPNRNYKFPIPQRALERNPELVQHPEWSGTEE